MLIQASVKDLRDKRVGKKNGFVAITMRRYPRGLKKTLRDIYLRELSPDEKLFLDFRKILVKTHDHEKAFKDSQYEKRFELSEDGKKLLKEIADRSKKEDVILVCQCAVGEMCHRELLMLAAKRLYGAKTAPILHDYPLFRKRLTRALSLH